MDQLSALSYIQSLKKSVGLQLKDHYKQERIRRQMEESRRRRITVSSDRGSQRDDSRSAVTDHRYLDSESEGSNTFNIIKFKNSQINSELHKREELTLQNQFSNTKLDLRKTQQLQFT